MQRLVQDIKTGQFGRIYLLYGEEGYLRKQYRDKLKEAMIGDDNMNYHYYEGKDISIGAVIDQAETLPFFAERRLIVLENSGFFKGGGEELAAYLAHPADTVCFVFVEAQVDKRNRLYKTVSSKGCAVEFAIQDEATLKKWILGMIKKENKNISGAALDFLLEKTGADMENIRRETEKLFCYCLEKEVITEKDIEDICTRRIGNHIFDMVSAIADKKQKQALTLYYELLAQKEPPMRILFLIARQFNLLLQVKELRGKGYQNKAIGEKVGLPGFIAGKYVTQASRFETEKIREAVEACVEAEEAVKTGKMNDSISVEMLIVNYSS
ncbi:DNA polymerase III subunit delta [Parablautia muri]|uniref:DNA polymerase III subunit delta n=1 Tax=Parablautia muri TaxID=2320879 RepID=A0A9X5BF92_9FIRM|nr:DNA polymerase III subunit delta [Parablautia muri]NBJ92639.1 DNA polymerase III subunit delta [Parablautia muri]